MAPPTVAEKRGRSTGPRFMSSWPKRKIRFPATQVMVPPVPRSRSPRTRLRATAPPGSRGLASPFPPEARPVPRNWHGSPSQSARTSFESSGPKIGKGSWRPPSGTGAPAAINCDTGIIRPSWADFSTVGGSSLGSTSGVRTPGASGRSCSWSTISPMGVMPPIASLAKGKPTERAPTSLPSM